MNVVEIDGYRAEVAFEHYPAEPGDPHCPPVAEEFEIAEVYVAGKRRPWLERRIARDEDLRADVERWLKREMAAYDAALMEP